MAKKWISAAIKHPGAFTKKAKSAGMSVGAYAAKVTKAGSTASTQTKRQANLAKTLSSFHPHSPLVLPDTPAFLGGSKRAK